jgi:type III pantothenate kinase
MLLAVDIGNTNVTLGWFRDGVLVGVQRTATDPGASAAGLELQLEALLRLGGLSFGDISAICSASVVPALAARLETVAARHGLALLVASAATIPIPILVDRPAEVGADRLVNALAVARLHGTPAVVADFGTATTVDAVGSDGSFVGGAIAPGLEMGLEALATRTARLPRVELRVPTRAIGRDTVSAVQAGAILGYEALATGLIDRVRRELAELSEVPPERVLVVLTGGLSASAWARAIPGVAAIDPDLTLKGLAILHAETAGRAPARSGAPGRGARAS